LQKFTILLIKKIKISKFYTIFHEQERITNQYQLIYIWELIKEIIKYLIWEKMVNQEKEQLLLLSSHIYCIEKLLKKI